MRLFLLFAIILVASALTASGQSFSVFGVDTSQFPAMKAKFYAFDAAGQQVKPSASEISVSEDGVSRTVLSVNCPPAPPPQVLSSVLVIDISSSMATGPAGTPNIDLAKRAATAWVQGPLPGMSECAITSFDERNYLNQDFTTSKSTLLAAIASLQPQGGDRL